MEENQETWYTARGQRRAQAKKTTRNIINVEHVEGVEQKKQ